MKYSTRLSDAAHVLALVAMNADDPLSSEAIATSIHTNPAFVRQLMSAMRRAGLVTCVRGHPRPSLARPARDISLLDIYRAVEGNKPLLHQDTHTNPECGIGVNIQYVLRECYDTVQEQAEEAMQAISLQDILDRYSARIAGISRKAPGPLAAKEGMSFGQ